MHIQLNLTFLMLVLTLASQAHTAKIFGGHEAVPHSRPYMVLLQRETDCGTSHCDGFLLSEDFVMTAAHCKAKNYSVYLGLHNYHSSNKVIISVDKAFPHENYHFDENEAKNDIMLLKLSSKAVFNKNVSIIKLAGPDEGKLPQNCLVSGWGRTSKTNDRQSDNLMEVNITLIENTDCSENHFYCSEGENGPAPGDSGGPLVCDGLAYGVVSNTNRNTQIHAFTKIPDYKDWIEMTIVAARKKSYKGN